jgi:hypothetical protein
VTTTDTPIVFTEMCAHCTGQVVMTQADYAILARGTAQTEELIRNHTRLRLAVSVALGVLSKAFQGRD